MIPLLLATADGAEATAMSIFEITMLVCFGAGWPLAVYKTWRSKTSAGKSLPFLYLILIGYLAGFLHKVLYDPNPVMALYVLNGSFVLTDIVLSTWYRRHPGGLGAGAAPTAPTKGPEPALAADPGPEKPHD